MFKINKKVNKTILIDFFLIFLFLVYYVFIFLKINFIQYSDEIGYFLKAREFFYGYNFSTLNFVFPLYPLLLYIGFAHFEFSKNFFYFYHFLNAFLLILIFFLIKKFLSKITHFNETVKSFLSFIFLFFPYLVSFGFYATPEMLFTFLSFSLVLLIDEYLQTQNKKYLIYSFLVWILTFLAHPRGIAFIVLFIYVLFKTNKNIKKNILFFIFVLLLSLPIFHFFAKFGYTYIFLKLKTLFSIDKLSLLLSFFVDKIFYIFIYSFGSLSFLFFIDKKTLEKKPLYILSVLSFLSLNLLSSIFISLSDVFYADAFFYDRYVEPTLIFIFLCILSFFDKPLKSFKKRFYALFIFFFTFLIFNFSFFSFIYKKLNLRLIQSMFFVFLKFTSMDLSFYFSVLFIVFISLFFIVFLRFKSIKVLNIFIVFVVFFINDFYFLKNSFLNKKEIRKLEDQKNLSKIKPILDEDKKNFLFGKTFKVCFLSDVDITFYYLQFKMPNTKFSIFYPKYFKKASKQEIDQNIKKNNCDVLFVESQYSCKFKHFKFLNTFLGFSVYIVSNDKFNFNVVNEPFCIFELPDKNKLKDIKLEVLKQKDFLEVKIKNNSDLFLVNKDIDAIHRFYFYLKTYDSKHTLLSKKIVELDDPIPPKSERNLKIKNINFEDTCIELVFGFRKYKNFTPLVFWSACK